MSQETVTRKKLLQEPDEFQSLTHRVAAWAHENRSQAAAAVGGAAALVLLAVGGKAWVEHSRERRAAEVAAAVGRYTKARAAEIPADLRHDLAGLADRHAGTPEGALARYLHAGALAASGDGDKARAAYVELGRDAAVPADLGLLARAAAAYLDLARGGADAALPALQELLNAEGGAVPKAQLMLDIAGIHEKQGRAAEARRLYESLVQEHPDGPWVAVAKERLRLLPAGTPAS